MILQHEQKIIGVIGKSSLIKDFYYTDTENSYEIKKAIDTHAKTRSVLIHNSNGINYNEIRRVPVCRNGAWFVRYRNGWERVQGYVTMRHADTPDTVRLFWLII